MVQKGLRKGPSRSVVRVPSGAALAWPVMPWSPGKQRTNPLADRGKCRLDLGLRGPDGVETGTHQLRELGVAGVARLHFAGRDALDHHVLDLLGFEQRVGLGERLESEETLAGGGKNCASFAEFSGFVIKARNLAVSWARGLFLNTPMPAWPTTAYS